MSQVNNHPNWLNEQSSISNMAQIFIKSKIKVATAESCTGGEIVSSITHEDGSSKIINFSLIAYSPEIKQKILGVPAELTTDETIVSFETAEAMNIGLQNFFVAHGLEKRDFYITITGWIGSNPIADSSEVYFTIASNSKQMKTFHVFVNQGRNKEEKKRLIVKRIFLELLDLIEFK